MQDRSRAPEKKPVWKGIVGVVVLFAVGFGGLALYRMSHETGDDCDSAFNCPFGHMCVSERCALMCDKREDCPRGSSCSSAYLTHGSGGVDFDEDQQGICWPPKAGKIRAELEEERIAALDPEEEARKERERKEARAAQVREREERKEAAQARLEEAHRRAETSRVRAEESRKKLAESRLRLATPKEEQARTANVRTAAAAEAAATRAAELQRRLEHIKRDGARRIVGILTRSKPIEIGDALFDKAWAALSEGTWREKSARDLAVQIVEMVEKGEVAADPAE